MKDAAASGRPRPDDPQLIADVAGCLRAGKPVRRDLAHHGRIHIDRPLPFLCVCVDPDRDTAARDVTVANAAYLLVADRAEAMPLSTAIGKVMAELCGVFILVEVSELARDRVIAADSPYLPPFEVRVLATPDLAARAAAEAFAKAVEQVEAKYRTPRLQRSEQPRADAFARLAISFAPIYRQPEDGGDYHDLRERLVAYLYDAILRGVAAFVSATTEAPATHRAYGRRVFVDTVERVDRMIDEICGSFDFLLSVTPINSDIAWREFRDSGYSGMPRLLYRPLSVRIDDMKRKLFAIPFDNLEDPVLLRLYRDKQRELDLQLTMLGFRESEMFREASRVLYGKVERGLHERAVAVLDEIEDRGDAVDRGGTVGPEELARSAERMIEDYRDEYDGFTARVEIRDDLPAGMMVSGDRLLISSHTRMARSRVEALLSHEVGVHLLTYFTGDAQGLRIFRSGLAGYEGVQEGLAVFAEYLAGGMTAGRLRLIAGRVIGCSAMLEGADFPETYRLLADDYGFAPAAAFNITLRLYRSGGLAKDAIYLRGLLQVLDHIEAGGSLEPFLAGKIAAHDLDVVDELAARGLLRDPPVRPHFVNLPGARQRLEAAKAGLTPADLVAH